MKNNYIVISALPEKYLKPAFTLPKVEPITVQLATPLASVLALCLFNYQPVVQK